MPPVAEKLVDCPRCEEPRKVDLRGSCRVCGQKIAENSTAPGLRLDIPGSWQELWPTLLLSGMLLAGGVGLIAAGVWVFRHFDINPYSIGSALCVVGVGLVGCAAKCWLK